MGKNKRRQIDYFDEIHSAQLSVDSQEEVDTLNWLVEACQNKIIVDFAYQPKSFELFQSVKYNDVDNKVRTLFRSHEYTADFSITFFPLQQKLLAKELKVPYSAMIDAKYTVYIDTKGTFNKTERAFGYNQKWMWQIFNLYVYKLVPKKFFSMFGVPEKSILTSKTKKPRTIFLGFSTLKSVFNIK